MAIAARACDAAGRRERRRNLNRQPEEPAGHPAATGRRIAGQAATRYACRACRRTFRAPRRRRHAIVRHCRREHPWPTPNRAPSLVPNRACQRRNRRPRLYRPKPQPPIKALPRWRIASKRHCASPAPAPAAAPITRDAAGGTECSTRNRAALPRRRAPRVRSNRSRSAQPRQNQISRPRSTTTSSRRWQVCWAARQTRTE